MATTPQLDLTFNSKDPWSSDTVMIIPLESSQVLMPESASILSIHAFLKMCKLPYTVREMLNASSIAGNGKVPVLKSGPYVLSELESIIQLAAAKSVSLSANLGLTEKADLRAYMSLIHIVLGNAMLYAVWLDEFVYRNITIHRVGSPFNFPLKYLVPWIQRRRTRAQLKGLKWAERKPEEVKREVETCLVSLSERLGDGEYFFGTGPTELDAVAFGYLFTMITTTLSPEHNFGQLVKQQVNLVRFCQRLEKELFSSGN